MYTHTERAKGSSAHSVHVAYFKATTNNESTHTRAYSTLCFANAPLLLMNSYPLTPPSYAFCCFLWQYKDELDTLLLK